MRPEIMPKDGSLFQEQIRLTGARADKVELDVKQKKRELIAAEDVAAEWATIVTAVKTRLLSIPSSLAPQLALLSEASDIEELMTTSMNDALAELARGDHF